MQKRIEKIIEAAIQRQFHKIKVPDFSVSCPDNPAHGDYATNVAMMLARTLKKNPMEIATTLRDTLVVYKEFSRVEIAAPGFINFWISPQTLTRELLRILHEGRYYGCGRRKKEKVQVEFVSANPTGPLTLANGRGGFMGDVLARILITQGHHVEREYYVNDTGNQIITLGKSLLAAAGVIPYEEQFYQGDYIKKWASSHKSVIKKFLENPLLLGQAAARDFLRAIKTMLQKHAHIRFDRFTSEDKHIHKKGLLVAVKKIFERKKLLYEKDGAVWLKTTNFGDDKDRVLLTRDGLPTYFFADAGHVLETKQREFVKKILILGPDHHGYVARIQAAAQMVGMREFHIVVTQTVRLMRGEKELKMSKRKGEFVAFEELIREVGVDAARFFFLEQSANTHIDFDLVRAKERSVKNPVYYIQYAWVRACHIVSGAQKSDVSSLEKKNAALVQELQNPETRNLLMKLIQFPEIVAQIAEDFEVHRLTRYALELARSFHHFYEKYHVLGEEEDIMRARLLLTKSFIVVLKATLDLLGISAPKKM